MTELKLRTGVQRTAAHIEKITKIRWSSQVPFAWSRTAWEATKPAK